MKKIGICFSKELKGNLPLQHIGDKLPVYLRLLNLMSEEGWEVFILTRKTYIGKNIFEGGWKYDNGKFVLITKKIAIDLVYDRTGGIEFPPKNCELPVVNSRQFKILCWDKWATYKKIGKYMPKTLIINNEKQITPALQTIKSKKVVLKPFNGLKGKGIFIGEKKDVVNFKFPEKYQTYVMQEFIDTSGGIPKVTSGTHDVRVVIVNGKPVWCHVRVPAPGSLLANAAQGGNLSEVEYKELPNSIKIIVREISKMFSKKFDNPIYSLDFGVGLDGKPYIFEINDQIGFPRWKMIKRDNFLYGLIDNFKLRLKSI